MKGYEVEYWVKHKREFWVSDKVQIEQILSEQNECKIISVIELPVSDKDFNSIGDE